MKKSGTRLMSLAMALVMCVGMVPTSVFADDNVDVDGEAPAVLDSETEVLPVLTYNAETGYVEVSISDAEKTITKYHISDTAVDATEVGDESVKTLDKFVDENIGADKYITFYTDTEAVGTIQYKEGVTVLPVNNGLVKTTLAQAYMTDSSYDSSEVVAYKAQIAADNQSIAALPNSSQKTFLQNKVNPYVTASSISDSVEKDITDATSGANIGTIFANYETRVAQVASITNADNFKAFLEVRLNDLKTALMSSTPSTGESSLLQAYPSMYAANGNYDVDKYVISGNNLVIYFKQNSSWSRVMDGELENWLHGTLLPYVSSYYPTFNNSVSSVTCIMPDVSGTTTKTFFYGANKLNSFDDDYMDELLEDVSNNFEEFVFDWDAYYVQYDASGKGTIGLIGYGDFGANESSWTRRDQADFRDWYTFDVAEAIYLATGCDVKISFVDWNNTVAAPTVTLTSASFGSNNTQFSQISTMLNREFDEYEDLEFSYTVNGTSKTVNIAMTGENFRENYDIWQAVDRSSFDNWVENVIALSVMAYQDSDIRIKLYDKRGDLIDTYELTYDDVSVDLEDVEDYLNNSYYSWGGIYWDFTVKSGTEGTVVNVEGDFRTSDDEWKDISSGDLAAWTQELALYIIESVPRNLTINIQNENGSTVKTYNYQRAGFVESYNFAQALNDSNLSYEGLDFEAAVEYGTSYVRVNLYGTNWDYRDDEWKDVKSTKEFKSWVEEAIGVPTASEFGKDVKVYIYDDENRQQTTFSFSKSIGNGNGVTSSISGIKDSLSKYAATLKGDKGDIKFTYTVSYTTPGDTSAITVKAKMNVASNNDKWTSKDTAAYNRLITVIKARASWAGKDVTINVVDSGNKTVDTIKSTKDDDILKKTTNTSYDPSKAYYELSSSAYSNNGNCSIDSVVAGYIADKASDFTQLQVLIDAQSSNGVKIDLPKGSVSLLKGEKVYLVFQMKGMDISLDCSALSNNTDYTISITPKTVGQNMGTTYIPYQYSIESNKDISITMKENSKLNGGTFKWSGTAWSITSSAKGTSMVVAAGGIAMNFTDISGSAYADDIRKLSAYGIMTGVGNNMFSPKTVLTRAEACQIVVNGVAPTTTPSGYFVDVSANAWYYDAVMKASNLGLVAGFGNGYFGPTQQLTYDQFVTILTRLGTVLGVQPVSGNASGFNCGDWARSYVGTLASLGVINASTYNGNKVVTREEAAHLLCSYLEAIGHIA